ncbi:FAD binding domain-containing protein [Streptomyces sp. 184]|uniref:FAD binding domain-containing protein n=1 Tax=Streptomyces sp. 184 TaxID=1827526 RepID=UPI003892BC8B
MKPPPFAYARATGVPEALDLLHEGGEDAKLLAGGQSLIPLMAYRLARPSHLVDVGRITTHRYVRGNGGGLRVGALVRHLELERATGLTGAWLALREAAASIGHHPIRVRGTCGGSLAHADPSAELPVVAAALDAEFTLQSVDGTRTVPASDFFLAPFITALEPEEMLVEVGFPAPPPGLRSVFEEFQVHSGDFAMASAAVAVAVGGDGRATDVRIALGSVGPVPVRAREAEAALTGELLTDPACGEAARLAATAAEPGADPEAGVFRRELVQALVKRALGRLKETS